MSVVGCQFDLLKMCLTKYGTNGWSAWWCTPRMICSFQNRLWRWFYMPRLSWIKRLGFGEMFWMENFSNFYLGYSNPEQWFIENNSRWGCLNTIMRKKVDAKMLICTWWITQCFDSIKVLVSIADKTQIFGSKMQLLDQTRGSSYPPYSLSNLSWRG